MTTALKHKPTVRHITQQAQQTGQISRQDYFRLTSALLNASTGIEAADRIVINRLLDAVRTGKMRLVH